MSLIIWLSTYYAQIWLRVTVLIDEISGDLETPYIDVSFVSRFNVNDPAARRIGLIIERELQEGMRREILFAISRAVGMEILECIACPMLFALI